MHPLSRLLRINSATAQVRITRLLYLFAANSDDGAARFN